MRQRHLRPRFVGQAELMDRTLPFKHELYMQRLDELRPLSNTDLQPALYLRATLVWLAMTSPALARALTGLADALQARPWAVPLGAFVVALLWGGLRRRRGRRAAGLAMAVAGLSGLAVELAVLLAAQEARGVVYHEVGALLSGFMAGLAIGGPLGRRLVARCPSRALQLAVGATGVVAGAAVGGLVLALDHPGVALPLLLGQQLVLGLCVGATYPATSAVLGQRRARSAASRAYAWDLAGATIGALAGSAMAVPVLGLPGTCLTCAALCLGVGVTLGGARGA
jgi:spermidine synthase